VLRDHVAGLAGHLQATSTLHRSIGRAELPRVETALPRLVTGLC
jgi:hypothetical protein